MVVRWIFTALLCAAGIASAADVKVMISAAAAASGSLLSTVTAHADSSRR